MALGDPVRNPEAFHDEAKWQRFCAICDRQDPFHAHHVVDKHTLKNRCGVSGNALYDTRNALRLCCPGTKGNCHFQFENKRATLPTLKLTDDNLLYAFEMLREYASDYLRAEYDDTDPDPRIIELESGLMRENVA